MNKKQLLLLTLVLLTSANSYTFSSYIPSDDSSDEETFTEGIEAWRNHNAKVITEGFKGGCDALCQIASDKANEYARKGSAALKQAKQDLVVGASGIEFVSSDEDSSDGEAKACAPENPTPTPPTKEELEKREKELRALENKRLLHLQELTELIDIQDDLRKIRNTEWAARKTRGNKPSLRRLEAENKYLKSVVESLRLKVQLLEMGNATTKEAEDRLTELLSQEEQHGYALRKLEGPLKKD